MAIFPSSSHDFPYDFPHLFVPWRWHPRGPGAALAPGLGQGLPRAAALGAREGCVGGGGAGGHGHLARLVAGWLVISW